MFNFIRFNKKEVNVGDEFLIRRDFLNFSFTILKVIKKEEILVNDQKSYLYTVKDILNNKEQTLLQNEMNGVVLETLKYKKYIERMKKFDKIDYNHYYFYLTTKEKTIYNLKYEQEKYLKMIRVKDIYFKFENNQEKIIRITYRDVGFFGLDNEIREITKEAEIISLILSIKFVKELFQNIEI